MLLLLKKRLRHPVKVTRHFKGSGVSFLAACPGSTYRSRLPLVCGLWIYPNIQDVVARKTHDFLNYLHPTLFSTPLTLQTEISVSLPCTRGPSETVGVSSWTACCCCHKMMRLWPLNLRKDQKKRKRKKEAAVFFSEESLGWTCTQTRSLAPAVSHANISSAFVPILTCDIALPAPLVHSACEHLSIITAVLTAYLHEPPPTTWKWAERSPGSVSRHIKMHLGGDQINRPSRSSDTRRRKLNQMGNRFTFHASCPIKPRSPDVARALRSISLGRPSGWGGRVVWTSGAGMYVGVQPLEPPQSSRRGWIEAGCLLSAPICWPREE